MYQGKKIVRYRIRLVAPAFVTALLCVALSARADLPDVSQSQTKADTQHIKRPTSVPYTGDLSIFEDPKRDENLQINRVMDLLKIKEYDFVKPDGMDYFLVFRVGPSGSAR